MWHCLSRVNANDGRVSEHHPSSTAFHALISSTVKEHWGATKNQKQSSTPEKRDGSSHQMPQRQKPAWATAVPTSKYQSGGTAHEMRNEFEWHTHQLECNSDFSAWDVGRSSSLNSTSILDDTQARGYFPESRLTYRDLEYVSRVSLVIHWLQLGYRMNRPGCSTVWLNPN